MSDMSVPGTAELAKASGETLTAARQFTITTNDEYTKAGAQLTGIMALKKKVSETFDPHIKKAFEAHKALVATKKEHETPLIEAEGILKRSMLGFQQEQEKIRREAEAKAQAAAQAERDRLAAQAAEAEAKARAEADRLRKEAEEATAAGRAAEAAKLQAKAESKENSGAAKVEALNMRAASVVTPIMATNVPKVAGVSSRTTYRAEVTDKLALITAVAAGGVPALALEVNTTFLNQQARAFKSSLAYPGVKVIEEQSIAGRST